MSQQLRSLAGLNWTCWRKACSSSLKTNKFDVFDDNASVVVLNGPSSHDHESDDDMIQRDAFREAVKQRVREDPSRPIKRAYDATTSSVSRGGILRLSQHSVPEFSHVRTSVSRAKQEVPRIPRTVTDVNIAGVWAETWNGDNFLAHIDNAWAVVVFATDENFTVLQQCRDLFIDGTFRTAPRPYYQYVTIHGTFGGRVIPLVSCLLGGKTVGHYRQILQTLKAKVRQVTGHSLRPKRVICDFELAVMSAVETDLPTAKVCGCLFHFRQSLYPRVNELGLSTAYKEDAEFKAVIAKFMSIGFLPLQLVRNNFAMLSTSRPVVRLTRQYPDLNRFLAYFSNTYITGRFPPAMWNVHNRGRRNRSNNFVEGYI
jgi:hypothetical protein